MAIIDKLVSEIDKRLQLDIRYYVRNSAYLIIVEGVTVLLGLASSIAFARLLPREIYGQYNYILSILGILAISTLTGMNTAITQAVARGYDGVLTQGTKVRIKWGFLGSIAAFSIGVYYYFNGSLPLAMCFMIAAPLLPFFYSFATFNPFLEGKKNFKEASKYQGIIKFVSVSAVIAAVYYSRDIVWIFVTYFSSILLLQAYFYWTTAKSIDNKNRDEAAIPFGKHMSLMNVIPTVRQHFDKIIVGALLGFSDLAIYTIAVIITEYVKRLVKIVASLIFPKVAVMEEKKAYAETKKRLAYLTIGFAAICGVGIALCPYIIPLLYSGKYLDSVFYAQLLFISIMVVTPGTILLQVLAAQKKVKSLYIVNTSFPLLEIVLLVLLIPHLGILGAVFAKLASRLYHTAITWLLTR